MKRLIVLAFALLALMILIPHPAVAAPPAGHKNTDVATFDCMRGTEHIVFEAVQPILARLRRSDHLVRRCLRMFPGVPVRRLVAASRAAARLARAQVQPRGSHLHAVLALAAPRVLDARHGPDVPAAVLNAILRRSRAHVPSSQEGAGKESVGCWP